MAKALATLRPDDTSRVVFFYTAEAVFAFSSKFHYTSGHERRIIMKKWSLLIIPLTAILVIGAACTKKETNTNNANENEAVVNENVSISADDSTNINENENVSVNANENENRNTNVNQSTNTNTSTTSGALTVTSPEKNATVESPVEVEGKSSAAQVYVRVKGSADKELFTIPVTVRNGEYHVKISVQVANSTNGKIEVYEKSASGAEQSLVVVPVTFKTEPVNANSNVNENENSNLNENGNENS